MIFSKFIYLVIKLQLIHTIADKGGVLQELTWEGNGMVFAAPVAGFISIFLCYGGSITSWSPCPLILLLIAVSTMTFWVAKASVLCFGESAEQFSVLCQALDNKPGAWPKTWNPSADSINHNRRLMPPCFEGMQTGNFDFVKPSYKGNFRFPF